MTKRFLWDDAYSVQSRVIDEQHKKFFTILNAMERLRKAKKCTPNDLLRVLKSLTDYAFYHFAIEEDFMERFGYERLEHHRQQHDVFRSELATFAERATTEEARTLLEVIEEYSQGWLISHILREDRTCIPLFQKMDQLL